MHGRAHEDSQGRVVEVQFEGRLDDVEALVVTHAHEDHIGAIPWLLKLRSDIPIYSSKFTNALIKAKTQEHRQRPKLHDVNKDSEITVGPFRLRFWHVNHSIPECLGVSIKTGAGHVVMTGPVAHEFAGILTADMLTEAA